MLPPSLQRPGPGPKILLFGALAVALTLIAVLLGVRSGDPLERGALVERLVAQSRLGSILARPDWFQTRWPDSRRRGTETAHHPDVAFRTGVLTLDLEIALDQKRPSAAAVAQRLAVEVKGLAAGYSALAAELESAPQTRGRRALRTRASRLADEAAANAVEAWRVDFGRWCEAGRLAAESGNVELLTDADFRRPLARLIERSDWDPKVRAELERLRDLLRPELNELQMAAIGVSFEAILARG